MKAAANGHLAVIKVLLDNEAQINLRCDGCEWPALFWAIYYEKLEVVQLLLTRGAALNLRSRVSNPYLLFISIFLIQFF